jgi:hypothetical protein
MINLTMVDKIRLEVSYFDEYKTYQKDMFPDDKRTENDLWKDYLKMAFKIEIRRNSEYSFLTYEEIDEVVKNVVDFC